MRSIHRSDSISLYAGPTSYSANSALDRRQRLVLLRRALAPIVCRLQLASACPQVGELLAAGGAATSRTPWAWSEKLMRCSAPIQEPDGPDSQRWAQRLTGPQGACRRRRHRTRWRVARLGWVSLLTTMENGVGPLLLTVLTAVICRARSDKIR